MRISAVVGLAALVAGCAGQMPPTPVAPAPAIAPLPATELRDLATAEKRLLQKEFARSLKDPDSAHFRWAKFPKSPPDGGVDYCAMVNAKNSYGGYIGFQPFIGIIQVKAGKIAGGGIGAIGDNDRRYQDILPKMCRDKGLDPFAVSD